MAKDVKPEDEVTPVAPPPKKKKLLIIITAGLVLLLVVAVALFFILKSSQSKNENSEATAGSVKTEKKKGAKETPPVYVALDTFTVNLIPENGDQFLQVMISVEVADAHVGDRLKTFTPKLRNNIMLLLSTKKASGLITKDGKEALATEIRDLINEVLEPGASGDSSPVKEVLFTSFIIQ